MPNKTKVASITRKQLEEIANTKMPDLNAASLDAAVSMIAGTCRSMGVTVTDYNCPPSVGGIFRYTTQGGKL